MERVYSMMVKFIISYIEDNELGVYRKRILVESNSIFSCMEECKIKYPTVYEILQVTGLTEEQEKHFTHEAQDQIQRSCREMGIQLGLVQ